MENNNQVNDAIAELKSNLHLVKYISGVQPIDYEDNAEKIERSFRNACRAKNELLIRVDYPFVRADQIAIKLICELYETLDANRFLCSQLPKGYKAKYVILYKSIVQNISVNEILRHVERKERETGNEMALTNSGGMDLDLDLKGLKIQLSGASDDAVINTLKNRTVTEDVRETNKQIKPAPLESDSATSALKKLINDLAEEELTLYSERIAKWWNSTIKRFASKDTLQSFVKSLVKPIKFTIPFLLGSIKLFYEILQLLVSIFTWWSSTLLKKHVRILFTLQISDKDRQETDFDKQLDAIITNRHVACIVFVY